MHPFSRSVTDKVYSTAVKNAKNTIFVENAFFSDSWQAFILAKKASEFNLARIKKANGEKTNIATCNYDKILSRKEHKAIVVVLPHDLDQPIVKWANMPLINILLKSGVDVCKWSSELANAGLDALAKEYHDDTTPGVQMELRRYLPKAMVHSKVWVVDNAIAYVGSANLTRRSVIGDTELGIVTTDPSVIKSLNDNVFRPDVNASVPTQSKWYNFLLAPLTILLNDILWLT
jgi:phosphatidylserine/phosphatidylglycerophosphate/cardiolipin synthase-like enzyme